MSAAGVGALRERLRAVPQRRALIGVAVALVLAAAGAVALMAIRASAPVVEIGIGGALVYDTFPEIVADLRSDGGARRYVKLAIVVELPDDLQPRLEASRTEIIDALNAYLREQRAEDLAGEAGAARVRRALKEIVNDALAPGEVKAVLFRVFIVS
ncbi:MAG: flagellar basal body-associated FliL family protein [Rhodospirillales bacterium]|nr:flagellar basal body-associated FliL family protein [Rhodospirillales bacterium]